MWYAIYQMWYAKIRELSMDWRDSCPSNRTKLSYFSDF